MADQETTPQSAAQETPGGSSSRGPEYSRGAGEVQADTPPYDEERAAPSEAGAEGVRKSFDASNAPEPGPTPPVSKEDREGMDSAEMNPEGPLGVGQSSGGRAEDQAPDTDQPTRGADRPVGQHGDEDEPGLGT
ncbi:MAG: hypothetical protein ACRDRH_26575 [Pseudonocardia sp.]